MSIAAQSTDNPPVYLPPPVFFSLDAKEIKCGQLWCEFKRIHGGKAHVYVKAKTQPRKDVHNRLEVGLACQPPFRTHCACVFVQQQLGQHLPRTSRGKGGGSKRPGFLESRASTLVSCCSATVTSPTSNPVRWRNLARPSIAPLPFLPAAA